MSVFHTCRWCQDRGCLACDAFREERLKAEAFEEEARCFLQGQIAARALPDEIEAAVKGGVAAQILYLLGAAIAHGRTLERTREGGRGAGKTLPQSRFATLDIERLDAERPDIERPRGGKRPL